MIVPNPYFKKTTIFDALQPGGTHMVYDPSNTFMVVIPAQAGIQHW